MYCYHCGKKIDENKIEKAQSSYALKDANGELIEIDSDAQVNYICPQCGHLIHANASEEDYKALSRASHSQLQRGANHFAFGMGFVCIGIIVAILAVMFYLLSLKTSGGQKFLKTDSSTFLVAIVAGVMAIILLVFGLVHTIIGIVKRKIYSALLKDLNNKTFIQ